MTTNELIERLRSKKPIDLETLSDLLEEAADCVERLEDRIAEKQKHLENLQKVNEDMEERIAIMSEGDTEAMLNKACETIADFNLDFVCDDNTLDDGWCNEHCKVAGQKPECFRHWLLKQTTEPPKEGDA